jgi:hypothetical protein
VYNCTWFKKIKKWASLLISVRSSQFTATLFKKFSGYFFEKATDNIIDIASFSSLHTFHSLELILLIIEHCRHDSPLITLLIDVSARPVDHGSNYGHHLEALAAGDASVRHL